LNVNQDHPECYRSLAVLLTEQGRHEKAFDMLEYWKKRSPASADPSVELARLHREAGDKEASEKHLLDAIAADNSDPRARTALGMLHEEAGDYQQAIKHYNVALSRNRSQPHLQSRVARLSGSSQPGSRSGSTRFARVPAPNRQY
ncbi:MAG: tetratricopeptide repeat protein, partial [Planctomycetales bacterium]